MTRLTPPLTRVTMSAAIACAVVLGAHSPARAQPAPDDAETSPAKLDPAGQAQRAASAKPALTAKSVREMQGLREVLRRMETAAQLHVARVVEPGQKRDEMEEELLGAVVDRREQLIAVLDAGLALAGTKAANLATALELKSELYLDTFDLVSRLADARELDIAKTKAMDARRSALRALQELVNRFPTHSAVPAALDRLSQIYYDSGEYAKSKKALQRLMCGNRERSIANADDIVEQADDELQARVYAQSVQQKDYTDCQPRISDPDSRDEAWMRLGILHRASASGEQALAVSAFHRASTNHGSPSYFVALQALSATLYEGGMLLEAMPVLDALIQYLDERDDGASSDEPTLLEIRREAVERTGTIVAELWRESALPDSTAALDLATIYFRGRTRQPHVRDIYMQLGAALRRNGAFDQALSVWRFVVATWPLDSRTVQVLESLVNLLLEKGDTRGADAERSALLALVASGSPWQQANRANNAVIARAQKTALVMLSALAKSRYRQATLAAGTGKATSALDRAIALNSRLVREFGDSKQGYEAGFQLAKLLLLRGRTDEAARRFQWVRQRDGAGRFFGEATRMVAVASRQALDAAVAAGAVSVPSMPDLAAMKAASPVDPPARVAAVVKAYDDLGATALSPGPAAGALMLAGDWLLRYGQNEAAEKRYRQVVSDYCQTSTAHRAAQQLSLISSARGSALRDAPQNLLNRTCGDNRPARLVRAARVRRRVAEAVRVRAAGRFLEAGRLFFDAHRETSADEVAFADTLFRAADAFAEAGRGDVALKLLASFRSNRALRSSLDYGPALWRIGTLRGARFDFDGAASVYLELAELSEKRGDSSRRARAGFDLAEAGRKALWAAAELRELDRVYYDRGPGDPGAATLFARYAARVRSDRGAASDAYLRVAEVYRAAGDAVKLRQTYATWRSKLGKGRAWAAGYDVRFQFALAETLLAAGDRSGADKAYTAVVASYRRMGRKGAAAESELAARAQFWRAEDAYQKVIVPYVFRWPDTADNGSKAESKRRIEALDTAATRATSNFTDVLKYKTDWSIAAQVRLGDIYIVVANKLVNAPPPATRGAAGTVQTADVKQLAAFVEEMRSLIKPLTEEAGNKWKLAVELARTRGVTSLWSRLAQQRLNRYVDAARYPVQRQEVVIREERP